MNILVITTGGTIGANAYADIKNPPQFSEMPPLGQDYVREALAKEFGFTCRVISQPPTDSKLIDESYLYEIVNIIEAAPEKRIIITHGTDTLLQSAEFFYHQLASNPALAGRMIILTGAMVPLANGPQSDGLLNLKFSLEQFRRPVTDRTTALYIVLCDFERPGDPASAWKPKLYPYHPNQYEKVFADDGRYSRLKRTG